MINLFYSSFFQALFPLVLITDIPSSYKGEKHDYYQLHDTL